MSDHRASRPAQPLDRAERNVLAEFARELERDDPALAAELTTTDGRTRGTAGVEVARTPKHRGWLEGLLVVLGMAVLFAVVVAAAAVWGLVGVVVVAASCVAVVVVLALMGDPRPKRR